MEAQIIEGSFVDVQRQLSALPFNPETRVKLIVTEPEPSDSEVDRFLSKARSRNGIIQLPVKDKTHRITTELVRELSEG